LSGYDLRKHAKHEREVPVVIPPVNSVIRGTGPKQVPWEKHCGFKSCSRQPS